MDIKNQSISDLEFFLTTEKVKNNQELKEQILNEIHLRREASREKRAEEIKSDKKKIKIFLLSIIAIIIFIGYQFWAAFNIDPDNCTNCEIIYNQTIVLSGKNYPLSFIKPKITTKTIVSKVESAHPKFSNILSKHLLMNIESREYAPSKERLTFIIYGIKQNKQIMSESETQNILNTYRQIIISELGIKIEDIMHNK